MVVLTRRALRTAYWGVLLRADRPAGKAWANQSPKPPRPGCATHEKSWRANRYAVRAPEYGGGCAAGKLVPRLVTVCNVHGRVKRVVYAFTPGQPRAANRPTESPD